MACLIAHTTWSSAQETPKIIASVEQIFFLIQNELLIEAIKNENLHQRI